MTTLPRPAVAPALALAMVLALGLPGWWPPLDTPLLLNYAVGESAILEGPPHKALTWQPAEDTRRISHE